MNRYSLKLKGHNIDFFLRGNNRAKNLRLTIYNNGKIVVTKPKMVGILQVKYFLKSKSDWILDKVKTLKKFDVSSEDEERDKYLQYKEKARSLIEERLEYFNNYYNFKYNRVSIKNQKTCWGSCSRKANLNFNYKIYFLPKELADYIIVHELCHLKELNHSRNFWGLVAETKGDYKDLRRMLRGFKI
jgi:predicted metal-dependent hydrolase